MSPSFAGGARMVEWITLRSGVGRHSQKGSRLAICHYDEDEAFFRMNPVDETPAGYPEH